MSEGKCTNCGQPSATDYCPNCEQFRERLEKLRADQRERRRRPIPYQKPRKQVGSWFMPQCRQYGPKLVAEREAERVARLAQAQELPLSGQDAALPVGDR
jgi:hypothetical protein